MLKLQKQTVFFLQKLHLAMETNYSTWFSNCSTSSIFGVRMKFLFLLLPSFSHSYSFSYFDWIKNHKFSSIWNKTHNFWKQKWMSYYISNVGVCKNGKFLGPYFLLFFFLLLLLNFCLFNCYNPLNSLYFDFYVNPESCSIFVSVPWKSLYILYSFSSSSSSSSTSPFLFVIVNLFGIRLLVFLSVVLVNGFFR